MFSVWLLCHSHSTHSTVYRASLSLRPFPQSHTLIQQEWRCVRCTSNKSHLTWLTGWLTDCCYHVAESFVLCCVNSTCKQSSRVCLYILPCLIGVEVRGRFIKSDARPILFIHEHNFLLSLHFFFFAFLLGLLTGESHYGSFWWIKLCCVYVFISARCARIYFRRSFRCVCRLENQYEYRRNTVNENWCGRHNGRRNLEQ